MKDHDQQLMSRIVALLSDVTGAPASGLGATSSQENTRGWDSTANLQFISSVEEEFGVLIPTSAAMRLRSVADMVAFVRAARATHPETTTDARTL